MDLADRETRDDGLDLVGMVGRTAHHHPDRRAISTNGLSLTYRELWDAAGGVAALLRDALGSEVGPVGLSGAKSLTIYASYLGILRAGGAVVPLSPDAPRERVRAIASGTGLGAVVTDAAVRSSTVDELADEHRVLHLRHSDIRPMTRVPGAVRPDDLAYVMFTSGSTGHPKGVPITHENISAYLRHVLARYGLDPASRVVQSVDLTFDLSTFDMFAAWSSGAQSIAPSPVEWMNPVRFLRANAISHLLTVPSTIMLAQRTRTLEPHSMPDLKWSLFCGEPLRYEAVAAWRAAAPGSTIENVYGPTELTVACSEFRLPTNRTGR